MTDRGNFGKRQGGPPGATSPHVKLEGIADARDPREVAEAVIVHMEATLPELWYIFLYTTGLDLALAHFEPSHPFAEASPAARAMEREVAGLMPDNAVVPCAAVIQAMATIIRERDLISKHLEFEPPWPHEHHD